MGLHQKMTTSCPLGGRLLWTSFCSKSFDGSVYTQTTTQYKVDIHIDNKGIVKRINNQRSYPHDYPYNTLSPDWDLIAQAATALRLHGSSLTIRH
eukprot:9655477-Ditylum_brightwellii.AAC.1